MALYAFDGTWNKPDFQPNDGDDNTNVFRFARMYAQAYGEDPDDFLKHAYTDGVGTRMGKIGKIVGGFTGAGGKSRVDEMLRHCATNFDEGDKTVDIVGYSRGAALAIHFANEIGDGFRVDGKRYEADEIRFLGLWDTVPAFGLPGVLLDPFKDVDLGWDLDLPRKAKRVAHAMARHERRQAFDVHRLDPKHRNPNVTELWFRGVHSDIGGGNGTTDLSAIALRWMMEQARATGIPFSDEQIASVAALENPSAAPHRNSETLDQIDRSFWPGDELHPTLAKHLAVGESKTVSVDSKCVFDFSGIVVDEGAEYTFTPIQGDQWKDDSIPCDATGWPADISRGKSIFDRIKENILESRMVGLLRRVREARWFELCACTDVDECTAFPVGHGQYATHPWTAPSTSPLCFFANDALHPLNKYHNNNGSIRVVVNRIR